MKCIYLREHKGPRVLLQAFKFIRIDIYLTSYSYSEQYIKFYPKEKKYSLGVAEIWMAFQLVDWISNAMSISYVNLYETITIASNLGATLYPEDQKNNIKKAVQHDDLMTW